MDTSSTASAVASTTAADGSQTTTTYGHGAGDAGPHAVTTATTAGVPTTYTYDTAGNRTSVEADGVTTGYTWDAEGELVTAGDTSNVYDADGNRIIRTDANGTTIYAGGQEIHINPDGDVSATRYYSFAGKMVAIRTDRGLGDGVTSIITDHHGTPLAAIPNGGHPATTAIDRLYTDPFGATRGSSGADSIPSDRQFLGKVRDTTGLTQVGARYYDEATGVFISVDPIIDLNDPQQWNAYAYAGNSPVTSSDPSGLLALGATDYADVKGKSFKSMANGTVQASPPKTVRPAVTDWWSGAMRWVDENQAEIAGFVGGTLVGIGVTAGCLAATGGVGSVGCVVAGGAAGGAVGGAITNLWKTQVTRTQQFSWGALGADTLIGGVFGAVGGFAGAGVGVAASRLAASAASPTARAAAKAVSCAVNSFVPGTAVLMADGTTLPIEDVQLGDEVLATDPETRETGPRAVTALITGEGEKDLTTITIADHVGHETGSLVATDGHPFWVPAAGEWIDAGELLPGDWLQTAAGTLVQITAIEHDHREQTVHNLTVADTHTYYVAAGTQAALVHNCAVPNPAVVRPTKIDLTLGGSNQRAGVGLVDGDIDAPGVRTMIDEFGDAFGCHTCGTTTPGTISGSWVPDHQPPSALVADGTPQTAWPHCITCARRQGGVVSQIVQERSRF